MLISRIVARRFKGLIELDLPLDSQFTVIVGDNEAGKSTVLEALQLALTGKYRGRLVNYEIDPYLFNLPSVQEYFDRVRAGADPPIPRVEAEVFFQEETGSPTASEFKGTNNSRGEDCPGVAFSIEVLPIHADAMKIYAADVENPAVIPTEYFCARWRTFAGNDVERNTLPIRLSAIDASRDKLRGRPERFVAERMAEVLSMDQRKGLSLAYKRMRHEFQKQPDVIRINTNLAGQTGLGIDKTLSVQTNMAAGAAWESGVSPHLDDLPFEACGKGEQVRLQLGLAFAGAQGSHMVLLEEPENHLSHGALNGMLEFLRNNRAGRQVVITTHHSFVFNKIGVSSLRLLGRGGAVLEMKSLDVKTREFFMKLPGFDTLRLVLADSTILVEGTSDELIVQRAYQDKFGKMPIEDGIDVISVGTAAKRFLEVAVATGKAAVAVVDNDGDVLQVRSKYEDYVGGQIPGIRIEFDDDVDFPTLEPQILQANSKEVLCKVFDREFDSDAELLAYMKRKKAECALALFETTVEWQAPGYILRAIG